jgi:hypothetical protein
MVNWTIGQSVILGSADHGCYEIALHRENIFSMRYTPNNTGIGKMVSAGTIPDLMEEARFGIGSFTESK